MKKIPVVNKPLDERFRFLVKLSGKELLILKREWSKLADENRLNKAKKTRARWLAVLFALLTMISFITLILKGGG